MFPSVVSQTGLVSQLSLVIFLNIVSRVVQFREDDVVKTSCMNVASGEMVRGLETQINLDISEFDEYHVTSNLHLTMNLKDFRVGVDRLFDRQECQPSKPSNS